MKLCEYLNNLTNLNINYYAMNGSPFYKGRKMRYLIDAFTFDVWKGKPSIKHEYVYVLPGGNVFIRFLELEENYIFELHDTQEDQPEDNKIRIYFR